MTLPTERPPWIREAGPVLVVVIWGLNFIVMKAVLAVMHPHAMNALRLAVSGLVLAIVHARLQKARGDTFFGALAHDPWRILGVGLVGYLFYQVTFIIGLDRTAAGSAALIMASGPMWTALLARILGIEFLRRLTWIGLATSIAGTVLIVLAGTKQVDLGGDVLAGNLIMVGASILWGSYTVLNRPLLRRIRPVSLTFYAVLVSLPFLFAIAAPYLGEVDWSRVTPAAWAGIILSGALSTALATVLWNEAIRTMGASHTAAYQNGVPVIALMGSAILLGETIVPGQIVGGILIIGGLLIMRLSRRPPAPFAR